MKRRLFSLTMVLVLAMGLAATGWLPGGTGFSVQLAQAKTTAAATVNSGLMSNLRGSTVYDSSHQQIGTVDAVVINTNTSQIQYVVVGTGGGILGIGKKEIPVPWADVQVIQAGAQQSSSQNSQSTSSAQSTPSSTSQNGSQSSPSTPNSTSQNGSQSTQTMQYAVVVNISKTKFDQAPQIDLSKLQDQGQLSVSQSSNQSSNGSSSSQSTPSAQGSNNSSNSQNQASSAQAQQQIQSFWQSNATAMSGASGNSQTTQSGAAQLVLAQNLIGATLQGQAPEQGTGNQGSSQSQPGASGQQGMQSQPSNNNQSSSSPQQGSQSSQSNNSSSSAGSQMGQSNSQASLGKDLGQVKDILVNLQTGKVEFALVALNQSTSSQAQSSTSAQQSGGYGYQQPSNSSAQQSGNNGAQQSSTAQSSGQQLVPVPLKDLTWTTQGQVLTYTGSQALQQAPTVTLQQVQNGQNTSWQAKVDQFWGVPAA